MAVVVLLAGLVQGADSCTSQPADTEAAAANLGLPLISLSGRVENGDGAAIASATVKAGQAQTVSDAEGSFHLSLSTGSYQVQVSAKGYASLTVPVSLNSDTELKLQINPSSN